MILVSRIRDRVRDSSENHRAGAIRGQKERNFVVTRVGVAKSYSSRERGPVIVLEEGKGQ